MSLLLKNSLATAFYSKKIAFVLLTTTALLTNKSFAQFSVMTDVYSDSPRATISSIYEEDFVIIDKAVQEDSGDLIADAARASGAAYNHKDLVALKSPEIRGQADYAEREKLAETKEVISFSATIPKTIFGNVFANGNLPAGIVTYEVDEVSGKSKITVAFHGTENQADLVTDGSALKHHGRELGINGYIHGGFYSRYMQSRSALQDVIDGVLSAHNKKASDVEFVFTGHSLGGALATLAAADFKRDVAKNAKVDLVTFSSPRVFDHKGAHHAEQILEDRGIRIWRDKDPISTLSIGTQFGFGFMTGFKHVGLPVKVAAAEETFSMANHSHGHHVKDATKLESTEILSHEGKRDSVARKVSEVATSIAETRDSVAKKVSNVASSILDTGDSIANKVSQIGSSIVKAFKKPLSWFSRN